MCVCCMCVRMYVLRAYACEYVDACECASSVLSPPPFSKGRHFKSVSLAKQPKPPDTTAHGKHFDRFKGM